MALAYKHAKDSFTIPGLGKLVLVNRRKARVGRNPATGETIQIKAKKVVKFRVAKAAKDAILGVKEIIPVLNFQGTLFGQGAFLFFNPPHQDFSTNTSSTRTIAS